MKNRVKTILGGSWGSKIEENGAERPQDRSKRVARGVQRDKKDPQEAPKSGLRIPIESLWDLPGAKMGGFLLKIR